MDAAKQRMAARLRAEETVMAMMSEDDLDRADVCTSLASLPSAFTHTHTLTCLCGYAHSAPHARAHTCSGGFGSGLDGVALFGAPVTAPSRSLTLWKQRDKVKSSGVGIIACLNIGTEPPDAQSAVATYSSSAAAAYRSRCEAWVDPTSLSPAAAAMSAIGESLHAAYLKMSPRAKYKLALDPTHDDVKRACASLRKAAKDDRVLIHYNGHGVPKPTSNAEVWVFNGGMSQYIPLALSDLIAWTGAPAMYVFDCNYAGALMPAFTAAAAGMPRGPSASDLTTAAGGRRASGMAAPTPSPAAMAALHAAMAAGETPARGKDIIVLLSCGANELLPTHASLPADAFTSCLVSPLKMALKCFVLRRNDVLPPMFHDYIFYVPGRLTDRRSPLGELNWILTSITDTIAWHVLPRPLFLRLFRQDVLCASLFRNYLLADRIMRQYGCVPQTYPALPATHEHPLWATWDSAVEALLAQLPTLLGYSAFDVQRLARLDLEPDVANLGPEWSELLPSPPPASSEAASATAAAAAASVTRAATTATTATRTTAATTAAATAAAPTAGTGSARGSTRRSSSSNRRDSVAGGSIPAAVAANLVPFATLDFDSGSMDPMRMPLPPSVNATGEQRVRMLRRRLAGLMPSTTVGPAPTVAPLGSAAYQHSVFFDEQLSAFEVWLREAAYLPLRRGAHLSSAIIEFVQASTTGSYPVGSAARLTHSAASMQRSGARSVLVPLTLPANAAVLPSQPAVAPSAVTPVRTSTSASRRTSRLSTSAPMMAAPPPAIVVPAASPSPVDFTAAALSSTGSTTLVPVLRIQSPLQLPIILQVLLSQSQRLRALQLLARFVDLGHEAVNLTLMVGIHPYVSKLLSNPPPDLAPTLVFVWAKILAHDRESGAVLVTPGGSSSPSYTFFIDYIERMASEHRLQRSRINTTTPRRAAAAAGASPPSEGAHGWKRKASPLARLLGVHGRRVRRKGRGGGGGDGSASAQSDTERDGGGASVAGTTLPQSARASTGDDESSILQSDQTVMALFVLCRLMEDSPVGRQVLSTPRLLTLLRQLLCEDDRAWVREWAAVTLGMLLVNNDDAKLVVGMQRCAATPAVSTGASALKNDASNSSRSNGSTSAARPSVFAAPPATRAPVSAAATSSAATAASTAPASSSPGSFGFVGMATRRRGASADDLHLRLPPAAASTPKAPAMDDILQTLTDANPVIRCAAAWVAGSVFREEADVVCRVPGAAGSDAAPSASSASSGLMNGGASPPLVVTGTATADFELARHASEHLATRARLAPGGVVASTAIGGLFTASAAASLDGGVDLTTSDAFARHLSATGAATLARDDIGMTSTHGYLRAAWAISYACYHAHGRLPFVWPSAEEVMERVNAQAALARRRRVLLHILASRMQRTLLPANSSLTGPINTHPNDGAAAPRAGDSTGSASIASAALTPPDAALYASAELQAAGYSSATAALPIVAGRLPRSAGSTLAMPTSPGLPNAGHAAGFAPSMSSSMLASMHGMAPAPVVTGSFQLISGSLPQGGAVLPVVIPIQTPTGIVQTTMSVPTSMLTPRAALPAAFQAAADAATLDAPAITDAPPADFLAEALAAAAAAAAKSHAPVNGVKGSIVSLHSVSSGAMFTSPSTTGVNGMGGGGGMGDRNVSHESIGSTSGTPVSRSTRRLGVVGSDSHGAFAQLSPGRGQDYGSKVSLTSGGDGGVGSTRRSSMDQPAADGGPPHNHSTPQLPEDARASTQSLDAAALAAKQAMSAARIAARQRLQALNASFPDVANACGRNLREACFAACLPPFFADGSIPMRVEALLAVSRFAANRTHEAGLCVAAAVTVMDFLTGGACLVTALGDDTRGGGAVASDVTGSGPDTARPASSRMPPPAPVPAPQGRAAGPTTRADRLRYGLMARLGHTLGFGGPAAAAAQPPPVPAARPAKLSVVEESPTPPSSRRDASMLGLPLELLPVHALAGALHFMSSIYRLRNAREDVGTAVRTSPPRNSSIASASSAQDAAPVSDPPLPPARVDEDAAVAWLLRDRTGRTDAVLTSTVRELGARGMLYAHIWIALVAATCDASDPVATVASNIVRRIFYRVVGFAGMELAGKLPRAEAVRPAPDASDARSPTWVPPPPVPAIAKRQRSESSIDAASLELWDRFPLPSHRDLALRSTVYERAAAYLYHPVFASSTSTMGADPMSATALARVTRHRLLQSALSEAVILGAAAYDDLTVQFLIESSAALWTTMQQYSGSSMRAILATNLQLARQAWQILAAQHLALTAAATPSSSGLMAQDSFAQIAESYQRGSPDASGSPIVVLPGGTTAASMAVSPALAAPTTALPQGLFYVSNTSPSGIIGAAVSIGGNSQSRPASGASSRHHGAGAGQLETPGVEMSSFHHAGPAYASAVTSSAPTSMLLAMGLPARSSAAAMITMSPALMSPAPMSATGGLLPLPQLKGDVSPAALPPMDALPPPRSRNSSAPAPTVSTSPPLSASATSRGLVRRTSMRPTPTSTPILVGAGGPHRASRLPSEYDGAEGHDARVSAALLRNDASLLASSMGTPAPTDDASPASGVRARPDGFDAAITAATGLATDAPASRSSSTTPSVASAATPVNASTTVSAAASLPSADASATLDRYTSAASSSVAAPSGLSPILESAAARHLSDAAPRSTRTNSMSDQRTGAAVPTAASTLLASQAAMFNAAGIPLPPPIGEDDLDTQLRSAASVTPRLPPVMLARVQAVTVRMARSAARKLVQKALIDTGARATTGLLFHPWADFIVCADESDTLSAWNFQDGSGLSRFSNSTGGTGSTQGLWVPAWTSLLRQRVSSTPSGPFVGHTPVAERVDMAPIALPHSHASLVRNAQGSTRSLSTASRAGPPVDMLSSSDTPRSVSAAAPTVHRGRARVTAMTWINEHDTCHLLTCADDGVVRIWDGCSLASNLASARSRRQAPDSVSTPSASARAQRDTRSMSVATSVSAVAAAAAAAAEVASPSQYFNSPPLIASFAALPELHSSAFAASTGAATGGSASAGVEDASEQWAGMSCQWLPARAHLAVGGGRCPYIRLWDVQRQQCIASHAFNAGTRHADGSIAHPGHVTTMSSAWPGTHVIMVGTSRGAIQVLDTRMGDGMRRDAGAVVLTLHEHKKWVVNVAQARSGAAYALISGSVAGDVRFWDLRRNTSVHALVAYPKGQMTSLALHDFAPLMATGSKRQQVNVFTNSGDAMAELRYHDGFAGQRFGPVSSVAFHTHRLYLGVGALDNIVGVYSGIPSRADMGLLGY